MSSLKSYKLAHKSLLQQQQVVKDLEGLVKSIERGENMIVELKQEMEAVNLKHQDRKTTQDDIAYLEDLLKCAKKKLAWEKQMASLQKRTPLILEQVSSVMNDPKNPPADDVRQGMLRSLQGVQAAMQRLEQAKS